MSDAESSIPATTDTASLRAVAKKAHDEAHRRFFALLDHISSMADTKPRGSLATIGRHVMADGTSANMDHAIRNRLSILMLNAPQLALRRLGQMIDEDFWLQKNILTLAPTSNSTLNAALENLSIEVIRSNRQKSDVFLTNTIHDFGNELVATIAKNTFLTFLQPLGRLSEQQFSLGHPMYSQFSEESTTLIKKNFSPEINFKEFNDNRPLLEEFRTGKRSLSELNGAKSRTTVDHYDVLMPSQCEYMLFAIKEAARVTAQKHKIELSSKQYKELDAELVKLDDAFAEATRSVEDWMELKRPAWEQVQEVQLEKSRQAAAEAAIKAETAAEAARRRSQKIEEDKAKELAARMAAQLEHASFGETPALSRLIVRATRSGPGPKAKEVLRTPAKQVVVLADTLNRNFPPDNDLGNALLNDSITLPTLDYIYTGEGNIPARDPVSVAAVREQVADALTKPVDALLAPANPSDFDQQLIECNRRNHEAVMKALVAEPVLVIAALGSASDIRDAREIIKLLHPETKLRVPMSDYEKVGWRNALKEQAQQVLEAAIGQPVSETVASSFAPEKLPPLPQQPPKREVQQFEKKPDTVLSPAKKPGASETKHEEAETDSEAKTEPDGKQSQEETPASEGAASPTKDRTQKKPDPELKAAEGEARETDCEPIDKAETERRVRNFLRNRVVEKPPFTLFSCRVHPRDDQCHLIVNVSRWMPHQGTIRTETRSSDIELHTRDVRAALAMCEHIQDMVDAENLFLPNRELQTKAEGIVAAIVKVPDVEPERHLLDRRDGIWGVRLFFKEPVPQDPEQGHSDLQEALGHKKETGNDATPFKRIEIFVPLGLKQTEYNRGEARERTRLVLDKLAKRLDSGELVIQTSDHLRSEVEEAIRDKGKEWEGAARIDLSRKYPKLEKGIDVKFPFCEEVSNTEGSFIAAGDPVNTGVPTGDWKIPIKIYTALTIDGETGYVEICETSVNTHRGTEAGVVACIPQILEHCKRNLERYGEDHKEAHWHLDGENDLTQYPAQFEAAGVADHVDYTKLKWMIACLKYPCSIVAEANDRTEYKEDIAKKPRFDIAALQADGTFFQERDDTEEKKPGPMMRSFAINETGLQKEEVIRRMNAFKAIIQQNFSDLLHKDFSPRRNGTAQPAGEDQLDFPTRHAGWQAVKRYNPQIVHGHFKAAVTTALADELLQGMHIEPVATPGADAADDHTRGSNGDATTTRTRAKATGGMHGVRPRKPVTRDRPDIELT